MSRFERRGRKLPASDLRRRRSSSFQQQEKKKGSLGILVPLVLLGAALTIGALLYVQFFTGSHIQQNPTEQEMQDVSAAGFDFVVDKEERNILYLKPPFRTNLSGLDGRWVVMVEIWLEVDSIDVAREFNEDPARYRRMTDDFLQVLKSWTYAELAFGNGMERLKQQLREHANLFIKKGRVKKVLFPQIRFQEILTPVP